MSAEINVLADEIISLLPRIKLAIDALEERLSAVSVSLDESNLFSSASYWRLAAVKDGMIKVRLIVEQNFNYIETFSVLAISRYILELLIWFRLLLSKNPEYAFRYAQQLVTDKRDHAREHLAKLRNEIELFKQLQAKEDGAVGKAADRAARGPEQFRIATRMIAQEIDRAARLQFCLYADDAKTRGYGFQAHLLETQGIPQLEQEIQHLQELKDKAISQMPNNVQKYKRWLWKDMAEAAGLQEQFAFVYAYTSRLLHATPTSLTTNQKNLELDEMKMLLNFVFVSCLEMSEGSERLVDLKSPQAN
jgi:hypothetical protein